MRVGRQWHRRGKCKWCQLYVVQQDNVYQSVKCTCCSWPQRASARAFSFRDIPRPSKWKKKDLDDWMYVCSMLPRVEGSTFKKYSYIHIYIINNYLKANIFVSVYTHMFFYEFYLEVYKVSLEYFVNNICVHI